MSSFMSRYALVTIAEAPFDAYPPYVAGGPAKVTATDWGVSYSTGTHIDGAVLNVSRWIGPNSPEGHSEKHPLDGSVYPCMDDAVRAAYEAGLLAFHIRRGTEWDRKRLWDAAE